MLEGTYVVLAQTPVGSKRGEVTFSHGVNGALRAVLNGTVKILSQIDRGGLGPALL